jgi:ssDNA-specific exonuclease RecJ
VLFQQRFVEYFDHFFHFIKMFSFNRPLQLIDIKNDVLKNTIIENLNGVIGIHMRKGDVGTPEEIINFKEIRNKLKDKSLSDNERKELEKESLTCGQGGRWYETFEDEDYLKIMNDIVKVKPDQKFYISTNGNKEQFKIFYDNFDILDTSTILNDIESKVDCSENYLDYELNKNCLRNVTDLFSLSHSKFLILHPESTWSKFAKWYKNVPSINVSDEFNIYNYRNLL